MVGYFTKTIFINFCFKFSICYYPISSSWY